MRSDFGYKVGGIFLMPPFRFVTSIKFIKIIENMLKRFMFISLFVWLALPLVAQGKRGSTYIFRFMPGKDMFFIPYLQNASQWKELCDTLNVCMQQIKDGEMYINVSSYAATSGTRPASRVAYMRNNRVKAELITRLGLKEKMFVTDRIIPVGYGANNLHDVVVVTFPANVSKVARVAGEEAANRVRAYNREMIAHSEAERRMAEQKRQEEEQKRLAAERAERERIVTEATTRSLSLSSPEAQGEAVPNSVPLDDSNTTSDAATLPETAGTVTGGDTRDQSTVEKQEAFDYLFATGATASRSSATVGFKKTDDSNDHQFKHRMSRLILVLNTSATDGFTAEQVFNAVYKLGGLKHEGTFKVTDGTTAVSPSASAVSDWTITDNVKEDDNTGKTRTYTMILYPQSLSSPLTFSATIDGQTYVNKSDIQPALAAGTSYTYTITMKKTGLSVSGCTIEGWTNDTGGSGNAEME